MRTLWQPAHPCRVEGSGPRGKPGPHRAIDALSRYQGHHGTATTGAHHRQPSRLSDRPEPARANFIANAPNQIWLADITYVETDQGWLYLATVMDLYSRRIVGWAMEDHLRADLPLAALKMAISAQRPGSGLIHHSDRGVQYASAEYRKAMQSAGLRASMSRKGNCYDNAPMESFFHTLKTELVHHRHYATRGEATRDIFVYIEGFYNRTRRHSAIGYISPIEMELKAA
jgi:putative transposase